MFVRTWKGFLYTDHVGITECRRMHLRMKSFHSMPWPVQRCRRVFWCSHNGFLELGDTFGYVRRSRGHTQTVAIGPNGSSTMWSMQSEMAAFHLDANDGDNALIASVAVIDLHDDFAHGERKFGYVSLDVGHLAS